MRRRWRGPIRPDAVLKVGGSLCARPRDLGRLMGALRALASTHTLVVVPGGGRFADEVRRADRRFRLDSSTSHWMAILGMDQTAHLLAYVAGGAPLVHEPGEIRPRRLNVLAPSRWLGRADPLPHSWSVTSDSIAAWVAGALRARQLVLLKDVDGVLDRDRRDSRDRGGDARPRGRVSRRQVRSIVDPYFAEALGRDQRCWIINGWRPERLTRLLLTGSTYGTEVTLPRPTRSGGRPRHAGSERARPLDPPGPARARGRLRKPLP